MKKFFPALAAVLVLAGSVAADTVPDKVKPAVVPFPIEQVRLLPGPFRHAQEIDHKYLLALDPERLLHTFRVNAGLPSSARPLGGWEEPKGELRGHFAGHYLSALALMYAATGDTKLKDRAELVVGEMARCQEAMKSGYLSAYPETFIDRVENLQRVWAPWYTLHKILAGLLDVHEHCGSPQALEVAKKFGDWVAARTDKLSDERMERMLGNEHGGMNEALANLYAATGDPKYLRVSKRFNHQAVIGPAARKQDRLTGLHANTQIPKFIGTARQYELTGEEPLATASRFFWDTVVNERSYVIGGHSDGEAFSPKERLSQAFGPSTTETCNTYNMLKLTQHLFGWSPQAEYGDYYERAMLNHILASQNPQTGMMCYYVPLRPGSRKDYNSPNDSFWCCTGTGVENHARYNEAIYFHDKKDGLYVNQFVASELDGKPLGIKLRQETTFPEAGSSRLTFQCDKPVALTLHVRHPAWAGEGFAVTVNGEKAPAGKPGSYAAIARTWKTGDVVQVTMPFTPRIEAFQDNPRRFAFLNGPVVLAAEVPAGGPIPVVLGEPREALAGLRPVAGQPNTFTAPAELFRTPGRTEGVTLEPFWKVHGPRHYTVYFDALTPEEYKAREEKAAAEAARQKRLEARTVDRVAPGPRGREREHAQKGDNTQAGEFGGRWWRHAPNGGWFSYDMKVLPEEEQALLATYWGSDGGRVFDVLVDGVKVAKQKLANNRPGEFYDETYRLPVELTKGKDKVTVKFQGHPGSTAGGVFELRVLKAEKP